MEIIRVDGIYKQFGKQQILKDVTFSIQQPGIVALIGPNGSGKSTLLNIMMNLLDKDEGEITILGRKHTDVAIFNDVAFLKDNTVLYPYLTGWDHLTFSAKVYGVTKAKVIEVVNEIGIQSYLHKKTGKYSLGMKQHLLIALAILNDPTVLILDEPLNGLDPTSILQMRELIRDLGKKGKTIIMSSHTLSEVDAVTNHILFLKDGRIHEERLEQTALSAKVSTEERYLEIYRDELSK